MMTPSSSFLFYLIQYYITVIPDNKEKLSVLSSFSVRSQCGERTKPFHAFAFYFLEAIFGLIFFILLLGILFTIIHSNDDCLLLLLFIARLIRSLM